MVRLNMNEVEVQRPENLSKFRAQGIDAFLSVRASGSYDGQPQGASARVVSTDNGRLLAGVTWQNAWGGMAGSIADRTMRKGLNEAAVEIANALINSLGSPQGAVGMASPIPTPVAMRSDTPATAIPSQVSSPLPASAQRPVSAPASASLDGLWLIEFKASGLGLERCPDAFSAPVIFTNRNAEGSWGRLRMTTDGDISGWLKVNGDMGGTTRTGQPVNLAGRMEQGVVVGTTSGGCIGSFTMSRR